MDDKGRFIRNVKDTAHKKGLKGGALEAQALKAGISAGDFRKLMDIKNDYKPTKSDVGKMAAALGVAEAVIRK